MTKAATAPVSSDNELEVLLNEIEEERAVNPEHDPIPNELNEEEEEVPVLNEADIEREVNFCSSSVIVYVLGANPPHEVLSGFIRRVWSAYGIASIAIRNKGPCVVRFKSKEQQQMVLVNGHLMFDNKPVIVKEWTHETKLMKQDVETVPIWVKLHDLELKFWGNESLTKICSKIGQFVKPDLVTQQRTFLSYARIML